MSTKGIQVTPGMVAVLEINGAIVYVEEVLPTRCKLVCLPDQPTTFSQKEQFLTPGAVKARIVSPYIGIVNEVPVAELSDRNKDFIGSFEKLRELHGDKFVDQTPEEQARMSVKKIKPEKAKKEKKVKNEVATDPADAPEASTGAPEPKAKRGRRDVDLRYKRIPGKEIPKEVEKKNGSLETKFNPGNRGWKVLTALEKLGGEASIQEVIDHLEETSPQWCEHPIKVVTRALKQLSEEKFGAILEVV